jgi:hypothetical protein
VLVSPLVARAHLDPKRSAHNAHYRQIARQIVDLAGSPAVLIGGSNEVVPGLFYYLPASRPMSSPQIEGRTTTARVMVCIDGDVSCRAAADSLAGTSGSVSDVTFAKTFLGYSSPPLTYRIAVTPGPGKS